MEWPKMEGLEANPNVLIRFDGSFVASCESLWDADAVGLCKLLHSHCVTAGFITIPFFGDVYMNQFDLQVSTLSGHSRSRWRLSFGFHQTCSRELPIQYR